MEKPKNILFILAVFLVLTTGKWIPNFAGPYRVFGRMVHNKSDDIVSTGKIWVSIRFSPAKPRQLQYALVESFNSIPFDDNLKMEMRIATWANNQWKKNAFVMNFQHACSDVLKHSKPTMAMVFGKDGKKCPVEPGHRRIVNRTIDLTFPNFPVFPYGRWLAEIAFYKETEIVGVIVSEFETQPRL